MAIAILFLLLVAITSWYKPIWGVALASSAFLINAAAMNTSGLPFVLIGAVAPLLMFILVFLKGIVIRKKIILPNHTINKFLYLLFIVMLISVFWAKNTGIAAEISIRFLFFCLLFFIVLQYILSFSKNVEDEIISFATFLMFVGFIVALFALYQNKSASEYIIRLTLGTASPIPLAILLGQSLIISLYLSLTINDKVKRFGILFIISPVIFYTLMLTNTRSVIIGTLIAILYFGVKARSQISLNLKIGIMIFILLVIFLVITFLAGNEELYGRSLEGFIRILSGELGTSEGDRVRAWNYGIMLFSSNPFLGVGTGNFYQEYIPYAHNIIIEIMSENGLIGLFTILAIIGIGLFYSFKAKSTTEIFVSALFLFILFVSQVSLTLWMHKSLFIWLALVVAIVTNKKNVSKNNNKIN